MNPWSVKQRGCKGMHTMGEEEALAFCQGHCEHFWVEGRKLGLLSDWKASESLQPYSKGWRLEGVGPPNIESIGAKCDERNTSSQQNAKHSPTDDRQNNNIYADAR